MRLRLETVLTEHDKRCQRDPRLPANPFLLGHWLNALNEAEKAADSGMTLEAALREHFCGTPLAKLLRAIKAS